MKWLDISNNKYTELVGIKVTKLEYLDISYNRLEKLNDSWTGHPNIKIMKSIDNKFKNLAPFKDLPKLEELYLESNVITGINGFDALPNLRKLHLRKNKIEKFDDEMPPLENFQYLNLRGNKVLNLEQLAKLFAFPNLTDINVINCTVERNASSMNLLIAEVLILNPKIKRFCKIEITDQNKLEAVYLAKLRWQRSEEERIKKEEDERKKNAVEGEEEN